MAFSSRFQESLTRTALRAYLAEFISTFFYVFTVIGSGMSSRKLKGEATMEAASLVVAAIANSLALSSVLFMAWDVSGGHVNPAVTFARVVGGHMNVSTALFYWISQMIASVMACLLLKITLVGMHVPTYAIAPQMTGFGASIVEGVLTFALVYTVYAARDPRRSGQLGSTGALAIGMMAGADVLAAGPFSGGSMNPACAFGSAVIAGTFKNQAVYWVGPLIGAAVAALVYDSVGYPSQNADSFVEADRV
ncbi:probable aquaporin TIP5-1 [Prosopis cineraria]|uniref:probable aquaporin TIP5-1 n=1 Tax=Prosopis cineraria TaxID=364024 RepID=UPI0024105C8E|nr:probable aquaporin TIP5-1 [Prosopis cineraria]XP_054814753.1 probable aquaporin TIP5-1 [Prosopis cineraria]